MFDPSAARACGCVALLVAVMTVACSPKLALPPVEASAMTTSTGATVLKFGEGMSRPTPVEPHELAYSDAAREARVSGTMIVRCVITTEGAIENCQIVQSVPMMEAVALRALALHRSVPIFYHGHAVSVEYTYTLRFKLAR